jgi:hypothetical protein
VFAAVAAKSLEETGRRVTEVTGVRKSFPFSQQGLQFAPEQCKPHHRIEKLRCYKKISSAFHKVFQRSVENLTRNCFLLLHFGSDRATTSLTEALLHF